MAHVWRFTAHALMGAVDVVHTLHFQTDLSPGDAEPGASDVLDAIGDHLKPSGGIKYGTIYDLSESDARYDRMSVVQEVLKPTIAAGFHDDVAHIGTNGSPGGLPKELCAYLKLGTEAVSKSGRGGVHSGPATRSVLYDHESFITSSILGTSMAALGDKLKSSFTTGSLISPVTIHPVVYSRTRHARGDTPFTFNITSYQVSAKPRFLRTRYK